MKLGTIKLTFSTTEVDMTRKYIFSNNGELSATGLYQIHFNFKFSINLGIAQTIKLLSLCKSSRHGSGAGRGPKPPAY